MNTNVLDRVLSQVLKLQLSLGLLAILISAMVMGKYAAASAFFGAACAVIPNAWFTWRLAGSLKNAPVESKVLTFFSGQAVKVLFAILLMALVALSFKSLIWPAFLVTLIVTLKAQLLLMVLKSF